MAVLIMLAIPVMLACGLFYEMGRRHGWAEAVQQNGLPCRFEGEEKLEESARRLDSMRYTGL